MTKDHIAYCPRCKAKTTYEIFPAMINGRAGAKPVTCFGREARCGNCGAKVHSAAVNEYNKSAIEKAVHGV